MADIQALCQRVIVIHQGTKSTTATGSLESILWQPKEDHHLPPPLWMCKIRPPAAFPGIWQSQHGETTRDDEVKFTIRGPAEK